MYKILSIDGGGMMGLLPALILKDVEERTGEKVGQLFDLICGTSIGGIMACAFAQPNPKSADDMVNLFCNEGKEIFSRTILHAITSVGGWSDSIYQEGALEGILHDLFSDTKLSDVETDIFVTSYKLATKENPGNDPLFFNSWQARKAQQRNYLLRDVARATSAAPTYFAPEVISSLNRNAPSSLVVDGALVANNPSLCGYIESQHHRSENDVMMLSLGTGFSSSVYESEEVKDWGKPRWGLRVARLFIEGGSDYAHNSMRNALNKEGQPQRYFRFNMSLDDDDFELDSTDSETLEALGNKAKELIKHKEKNEEMDALLSLLKPAGSSGNT